MDTIIQTSKQKIWYDEAGIAIPDNRITKAERLKERSAAKILKGFEKYQAEGIKLRDLLEQLCEEAYIADMEEKGVKPSKNIHGYTFFCFNRTVKVERKVQGNPTYDLATMEAAKIKFDEYLKNNVTGTEDFTKDLIRDAFEARNGQFDKARINKLISYKNRSKKKSFIDACELLSTAVRYPSKSIYYRVWKKDEHGKYQNINVQFSAL